LGPNILLNTLFSNTLSLCSSLIVTGQVSHSCETYSLTLVLTRDEWLSPRSGRFTPGLAGSRAGVGAASKIMIVIRKVTVMSFFYFSWVI
jgi:hypothetical protein